MKEKYSGEKGFGLMIAILVVAVLAIGGTAYYSAQNDNNESNVETSNNADVNATTSVKAEVDLQSGTLRNLIALGKTTMCTVESSEATGNTSGTVYIEGESRFRGDFVTSTSGGVVESHMIKSGDNIYAWSGTQGAKMSATQSADASAKTSASGNVDLDKKVNYKCVEWNKDESKFTIPSNVNFIDINAMINGKIDTGIKGTLNY